MFMLVLRSLRLWQELLKLISNTFQQLVQAGMGTHFPSTGFSPTAPSVGPESLSVAVAVKNAINDPLMSLKPDANTQQQQQPNISATHVRNSNCRRFLLSSLIFHSVFCVDNID